MPLRILIDLQSAQNGSRHRGIGRYSLALAEAIVRNAAHHRVFILLNSLFPDTIPLIQVHFSTILPKDRFLILTFQGPVSALNIDNSWRRRTAELLREYAIEELNPDVLLVSSMIEGATDDSVTSVLRLPGGQVPTVAVIYDLIPLMDGENHINGQSAREWYLGKISSLTRVECLFAISQSTMDEAIRMLDIHPSRIRNISSAADKFFSPTALSLIDPNQITRRFGITRKYIMHSSAFEPRKNFQGLIRAFAALPADIRSEYQLVLVTNISRSVEQELIAIAANFRLASTDLILTGFVSDSDLRELYAACHLFVFPSFSEGFGLPPLEAMSCGAATIGSHVTSVREVIGREDALFDPASDQSITTLMYKALTDIEFYESLKTHARKHVANFSWDQTAERAIAGMQNLVDKRESHWPPINSRAQQRRKLIEALAEISIEFEPGDSEIRELARNMSANELAVRQLAQCAAFRSNE